VQVTRAKLANDADGMGCCSFCLHAGTLFLWVMWPSFNAVLTSDSQRMRAISNTFLSLCACVMTTFILSMLTKRRLDMVHIQNSTLAGGVAVGACADMYMEPAGAMLIGSFTAVVSVLGYVYLSPWLASKAGLFDTCGVHNLHGMPGVISAICSAIIVRVRPISSSRCACGVPWSTCCCGDRRLRLTLTTTRRSRRRSGPLATAHRQSKQTTRCDRCASVS
jgi:hypothetical protein